MHTPTLLSRAHVINWWRRQPNKTLTHILDVRNAVNHLMSVFSPSGVQVSLCACVREYHHIACNRSDRCETHVARCTKLNTITRRPGANRAWNRAPFVRACVRACVCPVKRIEDAAPGCASHLRWWNGALVRMKMGKSTAVRPAS